MRSKPDLVVAESHRHGLGARLFLTNTDWQLIRLCPAPLLFVKQARAYGKARVLAAIDPLHANAKSAGLDARILDTAQALAAAHSGSVDATHCYIPLVGLIPTAFGEPAIGVIDPQAEQQYERNIKRTLERTVARIDLPARRLHLVMGSAFVALLDLARRLRTDVLVMGAVSRGALERLFIGNTAERTIDRAPCDVLIVKPRRFKTTVSRRPAATNSPLPVT